MRATKLQFSHLLPISSYHAIELPEFANVRNLNGAAKILTVGYFRRLGNELKQGRLRVLEKKYGN